MKNKNLLTIGTIVLVVLGGFFFFNTGKKPETASVFPTPEEQAVPTLSSQDLGLTFNARSDNKAVKFSIKNASDIESVEYEISYLAKGDIPRGAIGSATPKGGSIDTNYIDLGTCSSGKCKYDEGVHDLKLLLKITKKDGKVYQTEQTLEVQ